MRRVYDAGSSSANDAHVWDALVNVRVRLQLLVLLLNRYQVFVVESDVAALTAVHLSNVLVPRDVRRLATLVKTAGNDRDLLVRELMWLVQGCFDLRLGRL
jgi:hypothetical protein